MIQVTISDTSRHALARIPPPPLNQAGRVLGEWIYDHLGVPLSHQTLTLRGYPFTDVVDGDVIQLVARPEGRARADITMIVGQKYKDMDLSYIDIAAIEGRVEAVKYLLSVLSDADLAKLDRTLSLSVSFPTASLRVVEVLLGVGARVVEDFEFRDLERYEDLEKTNKCLAARRRSDTLIERAVRSEQPDIILALVDAGYRIHPYIMETAYRYPRMLRLLAAQDVDYDMKILQQAMMAFWGDLSRELLERKQAMMEAFIALFRREGVETLITVRVGKPFVLEMNPSFTVGELREAISLGLGTEAPLNLVVHRTGEGPPLPYPRLRRFSAAEDFGIDPEDADDTRLFALQNYRGFTHGNYDISIDES